MRSEQGQQSGSASRVWRVLAFMAVVGALVGVAMLSQYEEASLPAAFAILVICLTVIVLTAIRRSDALVWALYALVWFAAVSAVYGGMIGLGIAVSRSGVDENALLDIVTPIAILLGFAATIVTWIAVLRREVRVRWAFLILVASFTMFGIFAISIVQIIGFGKLVIQAMGRQSVFGRSRLTAGKITARPQGLVENRSYE